MICPHCGRGNPEGARFCMGCGQATPAAQPQMDPMSGLIPYHNKPALIGYYCGVFGLIPCLGIPLAIAGFILGIQGLRLASRQPEAKGTAHAWIGIVLGGLSAGIQLALILFGFIANATSY